MFLIGGIIGCIITSMIWMFCVEQKENVSMNVSCSTSDVILKDVIYQIDNLICCHAEGYIDDNCLYVSFDEIKRNVLKDGESDV